MEANALAASLRAADTYELWTKLASAPRTVSQLASELALHVTGCERVLEVLRSFGLLELRGDEYSLPEKVAVELRGPAPVGPAARMLWDQVVEYMRTGETVVRMASPTERGHKYAEATGLLGELFMSAASVLAAQIAPKIAGADPRILDVGAGSGVWSLAILERLERGQLTAFDLPGVTPVFLDRAASLALEKRTSTIEGDYHRLELGERTFDVIILANVLHLEKDVHAEALVERCLRSLAPSGMMVIIDMISQGTEADERRRAAYALHLALRLPDGYPHSAAQMLRWLGDGFKEIETLQVGASLPSMAAIVARR